MVNQTCLYIYNKAKFITNGSFRDSHVLTKPDTRIYFKTLPSVLQSMQSCLALYTVACVKFNYARAVRPAWLEEEAPGRWRVCGQYQHWAHCPGPRPWDGPLPCSYGPTHNTRSRHTEGRTRSTLPQTRAAASQGRCRRDAHCIALCSIIHTKLLK